MLEWKLVLAIAANSSITVLAEINIFWNRLKMTNNALRNKYCAIA